MAKKNRSEDSILLKSVLQALVTPDKYLTLNNDEQLEYARRLVKKYPALEECIIDDWNKYSDLKFYWSLSGFRLIERGIKRGRLTLSEPKRQPLTKDKTENINLKTSKKPKNILEFIYGED